MEILKSIEAIIFVVVVVSALLVFRHCRRKKRHKYLLIDAHAYFNEGKYANALLKFSKASGIFRSKEIFKKEIDCLLEMGKLDDAITYAKAIVTKVDRDRKFSYDDLYYFQKLLEELRKTNNYISKSDGGEK